MPYCEIATNALVGTGIREGVEALPVVNSQEIREEPDNGRRTGVN